MVVDHTLVGLTRSAACFAGVMAMKMLDLIKMSHPQWLRPHGALSASDHMLLLVLIPMANCIVGELMRAALGAQSRGHGQQFQQGIITYVR